MKSLLLFLLFSFTLSALASDENYFYQGRHYNITYSLKASVQTIYLEGNILSDLVEDLRGFKHVGEILKPGINVELILQSGGGFQLEMDKLSQAIKKACDSKTTECRVTTRVFDMCASACIPLFMVGDLREASSSAHFGFHQAAVAPGFLRIPGVAQGSLKEKGVNRDWLKENRQMFSSLQVTWLLPSEMQGSDIVTKIIP